MKMPHESTLWCHRCKAVRKHCTLTCSACGNRKSLTEIVCTYAVSEDEVLLPLNLIPLSEAGQRYRKKWLHEANQ